MVEKTRKAAAIVVKQGVNRQFSFRGMAGGATVAAGAGKTGRAMDR